jgi:beta-lactamase regulating signal transducer with metallopeptidase domain
MSLVAAGAFAKTWLATLGMMAVQGGLLVIAALVLARAGRLRPAWQAAMWFVVAAKLALPWGPAMPWSLSDLIASFSDRGELVVHVVAPGAALAPAPAPLAWPAIGWLLLAFAWLAGAVFVIARALLAHRRTHAAAARAVPAPPRARALLGALAPRSRVRLAVGDADVGPYVVGVLRPIVVVPPVLLDEPALLRAALLHELAHVRRGDALARIVQVLASAMMWWFPLVRLVHRRLELAREAACDAWALEAAEVSRPAYARLLVQMAALRPAAAIGLAAHPHALAARVASVLGPPVRARLSWIHRIALVAWVAVALGGARSASARGRTEVCIYTPRMAEALFHAYPEADLDGDGLLSRDEACDLTAELRREPELRSSMSPEAEAELATLLAEPLCCNCDGQEVYSSPETTTCMDPGVP